MEENEKKKKGSALLNKKRPQDCSFLKPKIEGNSECSSQTQVGVVNEVAKDNTHTRWRQREMRANNSNNSKKKKKILTNCKFKTITSTKKVLNRTKQMKWYSVLYCQFFFLFYDYKRRKRVEVVNVQLSQAHLDSLRRTRRKPQRQRVCVCVCVFSPKPHLTRRKREENREAKRGKGGKKKGL